jgi:adenine phosphoribosyltransferase
VSTLLKDARGYALTVETLAARFRGRRVDKIVAIESRGFVIAGPVATALGAGIVMARKRGKLPAAVEEIEYALEYGTDCIQIHRDAIDPGEHCLVIDDLLATGGTADATSRLIERLGGTVVGLGFIVNLPDLPGATRLARYDLQWLVEFGGH